MGRPSILSGVYFRMVMMGYFEGIRSERRNRLERCGRKLDRAGTPRALEALVQALLLRFEGASFCVDRRLRAVQTRSARSWPEKPTGVASA